MYFLDMLGVKFGFLLPYELVGQYKVRCRCICGVDYVANCADVKQGRVTDCGCQTIIYAEPQERRPLAVHGCSAERLYNIWRNMKSYCYNPQHPSYKTHGALGIRVCKSWYDNYITFRDWAYKAGYTETKNVTNYALLPFLLERYDQNEHFTPENCYWVPKKYKKRIRLEPKKKKEPMRWRT